MSKHKQAHPLTLVTQNCAALLPEASTEGDQVDDFFVVTTQA
jgi:hypothetical protein